MDRGRVDILSIAGPGSEAYIGGIDPGGAEWRREITGCVLRASPRARQGLREASSFTVNAFHVLVSLHGLGHLTGYLQLPTASAEATYRQHPREVIQDMSSSSKLQTFFQMGSRGPRSTFAAHHHLRVPPAYTTKQLVWSHVVLDHEGATCSPPKRPSDRWGLAQGCHRGSWCGRRSEGSSVALSIRAPTSGTTALELPSIPRTCRRSRVP